MNSKDLRAVQHVDRLTKMGHPFTKNRRPYQILFLLRHVLHKFTVKPLMMRLQANHLTPALMTQLEGLANRGYTEGFLRRHVHSEYQNYETGSSSFDHQQFCGEVLERNGDDIKIDVKNRFVVGDSLELMTPQRQYLFYFNRNKDKKGNLIEDAKGSGHIVEIPVPADVDMRYALLIRNLPNSTADISRRHHWLIKPTKWHKLSEYCDGTTDYRPMHQL